MKGKKDYPAQEMKVVMKGRYEKSSYNCPVTVGGPEPSVSSTSRPVTTRRHDPH